MSSFDPMATAIDWLDCYRAADPSILDLYAPDAALECACDGAKTLIGRSAISEYWRLRFSENPAGELTGLHFEGDFVAVSYETGGGVVQAVLQINEGKIVRSRCAPLETICPVAPQD
jgi:hypothetical protein